MSYVALVTPFEIAFEITGLAWLVVNRVLDAFFITGNCVTQRPPPPFFHARLRSSLR